MGSSCGSASSNYELLLLLLLPLLLLLVEQAERDNAEGVGPGPFYSPVWRNEDTKRRRGVKPDF